MAVSSLHGGRLALVDRHGAWTRYEITLTVNRRTVVWSRYAPDAAALVAGTLDAAAREWPTATVTLVGYQETGGVR